MRCCRVVELCFQSKSTPGGHCSTCLSVTSQTGATPIHVAAWLGLADIVTLLAEAGGDLTAVDKVRADRLKATMAWNLVDVVQCCS